MWLRMGALVKWLSMANVPGMAWPSAQSTNSLNSSVWPLKGASRAWHWSCFWQAAEVQRVALARGTGVVGDDEVVGDLVALLGVAPEPADVVDELAVVVDQGVVDG